MKKRKEKPTPGPHLTPTQRRIEAIEAVLVTGDDVPELNPDGDELTVYNAPRRAHRRYAWDAVAQRWRLRRTTQVDDITNGPRRLTQEEWETWSRPIDEEEGKQGC